MCRGGKDGQIRRCPSHSDKGCIDNRNARRRELRAGKAQRKSLSIELTRNSVKHVRGDAIDNAYYMGESFDREKFKAIQDVEVKTYDGRIAGPLKPAYDEGLWTSPGSVQENGTVSTEWSKWCEAEGSDCSDNNVSHIKAMPDAVVVIIDNDEDLKSLYKQFPDSTGRTFSFKKMQAAGVDGIHLSQEGLNNISRSYSAANSSMQDMYGWDIESTLWLNNTFIQRGANRKVDGGRHRVNYDDSGRGDDDTWGNDDVLSDNDLKKIEDRHNAITHYAEMKETAVNGESINLDVNDSRITTLLDWSMKYQKVVKVNARPAIVGEKITTTLADGTFETTNVAEEGTFIVTNPGGEECILTPEAFNARYQPTDDNGVWQAKGKIRALPNPTNHPITIVAPWGEKQHGESNCWIANSLDEQGNIVEGDRYIIGHQELVDTYALDFS